jgi:hypothetical protein
MAVLATATYTITELGSLQLTATGEARPAQLPISPE